MGSYQSSILWKKAFCQGNDDGFEPYRKRLEVVYAKFWEQTVELSTRIAHDLPGLTLHDERHLSALWDRASLLAGDDTNLNPLETFVLGGAILLHDIGLTVLAYENGLEGIKGTTIYQDVLAALRRQNDIDNEIEKRPDVDIEKIQNQALFATLRKLHASQAKVVASKAFLTLENKTSYLIDDDGIRLSLSDLIGKIAASHHWDRSKLESNLYDSGAPGDFPRHWSIRELNIACLLRCADAIQIDSARAPYFSSALHRPTGVSKSHWIAQGRLRQPIPDGEKLIFRSQEPFLPEEADAWWVAYDLVRIADDELRGCHDLLQDQKRPVFTVNRVAGIDNAQSFSRYVTTENWAPVKADVHISDVCRIVSVFGGAGLYGKSLEIPVRELIQNAADAVRARKVLENDSFYKGVILVRVEEYEDDKVLLSVSDNGIGMSKFVLTGTLLDFGKSLWTSDEVQEEFPGLSSVRLRQIGRFGIGFFSTLMLSDKILVTSKRYDREDVYSLKFSDGIKGRPILLEADRKELSGFSTRISLVVDRSDYERIFECHNIDTRKKIKYTFVDFLARLCPALDCDVYAQLNENNRILVHRHDWFSQNAEEWLTEIIGFESSWEDDDVKEEVRGYLRKISSLLRELKNESEDVVGRAAISYRNLSMGVYAIGGLATSIGHRGLSRGYVGSLPQKADMPTRSGGPNLLSSESMANWATEQASLLKELGLDLYELYCAAENITRHGGDPSDIAVIVFNRKIVTLENIFDQLKMGKPLYAVCGEDIHSNSKEVIVSQIQYKRQFSSMRFDHDELQLLEDAIEGLRVVSITGEDVYHKIPTQDDSAKSSFLWCLERFCKKKGYILCMETKEDFLVARYIGKSSEREELVQNMEMREDVIMLTVSKE